MAKTTLNDLREEIAQRDAEISRLKAKLFNYSKIFVSVKNLIDLMAVPTDEESSEPVYDMNKREMSPRY